MQVKNANTCIFQFEITVGQRSMKRSTRSNTAQTGGSTSETKILSNHRPKIYFSGYGQKQTNSKMIFNCWQHFHQYLAHCQLHTQCHKQGSQGKHGTSI